MAESEAEAKAEREASEAYARTLAHDDAISRENRDTTWKLSQLGQHRARIPLDAFLSMKAEYQKTHPGQDPLHDKDFMEAALRDNPRWRIKTTRGTRGQEIIQATGRPKGKVY